MKLEQTDLPLLFSNTNIPDIFFTEYLSQSNGDYIKVYLFMVFLSKYNKDIKMQKIAGRKRKCQVIVIMVEEQKQHQK